MNDKHWACGGDPKCRFHGSNHQKRMNMERTSRPNAIEIWKQISRYESNSMKPQFVHVAGINHRKTSTLSNKKLFLNCGYLMISPSSHHCTKIAKGTWQRSPREGTESWRSTGISGYWLAAHSVDCSGCLGRNPSIHHGILPFLDMFQTCFSCLILARKSCIRVMESKLSICQPFLGPSFHLLSMAYGDSHVVGVSGHVGRRELQQQLHRSMPGLVVCVPPVTQNPPLT